MNLDNITLKWTRPDTKDRMIYDSIHIKCPAEVSIWGQKVDQGLPGAGGRGEGAAKEREFSSQGNKDVL